MGLVRGADGAPGRADRARRRWRPRCGWRSSSTRRATRPASYFGTDTRVSGLLIGAAAAMVWTPWRWPWAGRRRLAGLDAIGWLALLSLVAVMLQLGPDRRALYRGGFLLVSVLSIMVVAVSVHPGATTFRAALLAGAAALAGVAQLRAVPVALARLHGDPPAGLPGMDGRTRFALRLGLTFAADRAELPARRAAGPRRRRRCSGSPTGGPTGPGGPAPVGGPRSVPPRRCCRSPSSAPASRTAEPVDVTTGGSEEVFQPATAALSPLAPVAAAGAVPSTVSAGASPARPSRDPAAPPAPEGRRRGRLAGQRPGQERAAPAWVARWRSRTARSRAVVCSTTAPSGRPPTSAVRSATARAGRTSGRPRRGAPGPTSRSSSSGPGTCSTSPQDSGGLAFGSPAHDAYLLAQLQRGHLAARRGGQPGRAARGAVLRPGRRRRA